MLTTRVAERLMLSLASSPQERGAYPSSWRIVHLLHRHAVRVSELHLGRLVLPIADGRTCPRTQILEFKLAHYSVSFFNIRLETGDELHGPVTLNMGEF
jgi:hypothetical protein